MAFGSVAGLSDPIEDYPGYWLKFYEQGTTTPLAMSTNDTGTPILAKAEVSSGGVVPIGFIKTAGDVIFIPYLNKDYDGFLFPTEAEADANDTANAIQIANDAEPIGGKVENTTDFVILSSGQTLATFQEELPLGTIFYINGPDVDIGRLSPTLDYSQPPGSDSITLTESYPEGTELTALLGQTDNPIVTTVNADQVFYDNTTSGLSAADAQAAIDELSNAPAYSFYIGTG